MDQPVYIHRLLLEMRRDLDKLRDDLSGLNNYVHEIGKTQRELEPLRTKRLRWLSEAVVTLEDMILPIEKIVLPEVNQARMRFVELRMSPPDETPESEEPDKD
jgi:hypothetical protein